MKELNTELKERLIAECRNENEVNPTIYLWHQIEMCLSPMCDMSAGEWLWSSDFDKIKKCYIEAILWGNIAILCKYDDYVTEEKTCSELLELYKNDFDTDIKNLDSFNALLRLLQSEIKDMNDFKLFVEQTSKYLRDLDVECDCKVFDDFNDVIGLVEEHYDATPVYETKIEYLINDYYG